MTATLAVVCKKCYSKMVVRTNRQTHKKFWGCSTFPKCNFTRELNAWEKIQIKGNPEKWGVFEKTKKNKKSKETIMQSTEKWYSVDKWYRIQKPRGEGSNPYRIYDFATIQWTKEMDKLNGFVFSASTDHLRYNNKIYMYQDHNGVYYTLPLDWVSGPYDSKEEAVTANDLKAFGWTETKDKVETKDGGSIAINAGTGGSTTVDIAIDTGGSAVREPLPACELDLKVTPKEVKVPRSKAARTKLLTKIRSRWSKKAQPAIQLKVKPKPKDKYKAEIDKIFDDHHERIKQREELQNRIESEFKKNTSQVRWNRMKVIAMLSGLSIAGTLIAPHIYQILYYIGF